MHLPYPSRHERSQIGSFLDSSLFMPVLLLASLVIGWLWAGHLSLPLISDMASYDSWGRSVMEYGRLPLSAYRPPVYPYMVGLVYRLAGHRPQIIYDLQVVFNLGIIVLIERLGQASFSQRHGRLAALLYATMTTPYIFSSALLSEIAFTMLFLAAIYLVTFIPVNGWSAAALAGLCFGLASLTRSIAFPVPLMMGAVMLVQVRSKRIKQTVVLMVVMLFLTIVPWAIRNYWVLGDIVPIDTISGLNLYLGNNPRSDGGYADLTGDPLIVPVPGESEVVWDHKLKTVAIGYIIKHPLRFLWNCAKRLLLFWSWPLDWLSTLIAMRYRWVWFPLAYEVVVVVAALFGTLRSWWHRFSRMSIAQGLLAIPIAYFCLSLSVFYFQARYRFPVMPLVLLFGVDGLWSPKASGIRHQ